MVTLASSPVTTEIIYPSSDGEPLAETSIHVDAILNAVVALRHYLRDQQALVLANQFLYYAQGFPKLRVAPDIMVIFKVSPGNRDHYKIWEEGQVPALIFEITSPGTKNQDREFKKNLYEALGVKEYWMFDPKGEWLEGQLQGYRLQNEVYEKIADNRSESLKLRLEVEGQTIGFYREDTGEKLLIPDELLAALQRETLACQQALEQLEQERQRAEQERQRAEALQLELEQLKAKLRASGIEDLSS
jgi:Uma2 family endonuclease